MKYDSYYLLEPNVESSFSGSKAWQREAERTWLCRSCRIPRSFAPIDAIVQPYSPKSDFEYIGNCFTSVVSKKFLSAFNIEETNKSVVLGTVTYESGQVLSDYMTFQTSNILYVRGGAYSQHRICDECGRLIYSAVGDRYITGAEQMPPISAGYNFEILIADKLYEKVMASSSFKPKNVDIKKILVQEEAEDNLPKKIEKLIEKALLGSNSKSM